MEDNNNIVAPKKTPLPPNYVSILDLQQRWLKQQQQQQQREKETESQEKRENGVQPILQYEKKKGKPKNGTDPSGEKGCRWVKMEKQHVGREEMVRIEGKEGDFDVHGGEERERGAEKVESKGGILEKKWIKKMKKDNYWRRRREREREERRERDDDGSVVSEAKDGGQGEGVMGVEKEEERGSGSGGGGGEGRKEGALVKGGGDHVYWKKRGEEGKRKVVEGGRGVVDDCGEGRGDVIEKKGKRGVSGNVGVFEEERGSGRGDGDGEGRKEGNLVKGGCDHVYWKKIGNGGKEGEGRGGDVIGKKFEEISVRGAGVKGENGCGGRKGSYNGGKEGDGGGDCGEGRGDGVEGDVIGKKFEKMSVREARVKGERRSGGRRWSYNGGGVWRGLSEVEKRKKGVESGSVWVVKKVEVEGQKIG